MCHFKLFLILILLTATLANAQTNSSKKEGEAALHRINCQFADKFFELGNYSGAEAAYIDALSYAETTFGRESIEVISILAPLVQVYDRQAKYNKALEICARLVPLIEQHYPKETNAINQWKQVQVRLLKDIGRHKEAKAIENSIID